MSFGFLDELESKSKPNKPSNLEYIQYVFFTHGIDLNAFNKLPIPYILSMMNTHMYVKEQEAKQYKKKK